MGIKDNLDTYFATVRSIAKSSLVDQYVIGFTGAQLARRRTAYVKEGFHYAVIIEDQMTRDDALWLEEHMFKRLVSVKKTDVCYRKYHHEKRDEPYRRSSGGSEKMPDALTHSVYMAWWEPQ